MIQLSILDQSPVAEQQTQAEALQNTIKLAQEADKLGYTRFWVSEHHNTPSLTGSSPEVLVSHLAAKTERIRIGSGGIMLPHYSAYKVAENFNVLEALAPGRIDMGIGRAPGGAPLSTLALQDGQARNNKHFPVQVDELLAYTHGELPEGHRFQGLHATPRLTNHPHIWMLGSSSYTAELAAEKGLPFSFAHFINAYDGRAAVKYYMDHFKPSLYYPKPKVVVSIQAVTAATDEQAEELAQSTDWAVILIESGVTLQGIPSLATASQLPKEPGLLERIRENRNRVLVGSPATIKAQLEELQATYSVDEFMLVSLTPDYEQKIEGYRLLADAFNLN
ncbi:LLM class flavin-dependent oxidoreductase [Paenibacillus sp. NPDC057934]|uniref:LLM class flavin-dependent oxidoreductase n=1 Tax=Paenibacillus sp. NPDC057934 TaxID=3346282 RepID=UPI0036DF18BA